LTGAADRRVVAIIPIVIDVVNVRACSIHHFCSYGFWAPAIEDYTRNKIQERMRSPVYEALLRIEDPYFYRDRLTMPKFIVNAAGDQYFPPDSSQFYFGDLRGPKYLRYVPNTNHSLRGSDAESSILAFYQIILNHASVPRFTWSFTTDGGIRVQTQDRPAAVHLWQATNPKARDFRLEAIGPAYTQSSLTDSGNGIYEAHVARPAKGWTAFFVELVYNSRGKTPLKLTTQVRIVPDTLPYKWEDKQP
ncbi:MAG TPA: PhoPQ-activated protein PqaA family protein, partial [Gemmataceae bacterium]|nr:PhoPQ-activated protein PqaA family protein [Gemmataceae bacterium]